MFKLYRIYLASSLVLPLIVSTVFFVLFLLSFQLFKVLQLVSSSEVELSFVFSMILDMAVTLVPMALPLSMFFSTIFCIGRISGDSEYIALRSFGIKKIQLLIPFLLVALIAGMNVYFLNQKLVPNAHRNLRRDIKIISSASLIQGIKSGQFFTSIPNVTLFAQKIDEKTKELEDVFLQIYNPSKQEEKVIKAKTGKIIHKKDESTGLEVFKLLLNNGNILSKNKSGDMEKVLYEEYSLPISSQKFSYTPSTKENMMSGSELRSFINDGLDNAKKRGLSKKVYVNAIYQFWNRLNIPLLVIAFTFLGFSLGVKSTRSRGQNSNSKAILCLIGYYAIFFSFVSMGKSEKIPMFMAVIFPTILIFFYAHRVYRKLDWQS